MSIETGVLVLVDIMIISSTDNAVTHRLTMTIEAALELQLFNSKNSILSVAPEGSFLIVISDCWIHECMYVCICISTSVCMCVYVYIHDYSYLFMLHVDVCVFFSLKSKNKLYFTFL